MLQPWMIFVGVLVVGFFVLLIAPTIHRRINTKSRTEAQAARQTRADELLRSDAGESRRVATAADGALLRDRLLLRGVRSELVVDDDGPLVAFEVEDAGVVDAVIDELDIG